MASKKNLRVVCPLAAPVESQTLHARVHLELEKDKGALLSCFSVL